MVTPIEERVTRLEAGHEHLATKADIAELRAELKTDIADLKASNAELKADLVKWMIGLMVGAVAVASSIALFVQRLVG